MRITHGADSDSDAGDDDDYVENEYANGGKVCECIDVIFLSVDTYKARALECIKFGVVAPQLWIPIRIWLSGIERAAQRFGMNPQARHELNKENLLQPK